MRILIICCCLVALSTQRRVVPEKDATRIGEYSGYEFRAYTGKSAVYLLLVHPARNGGGECIVIESSTGWVEKTMMKVGSSALKRIMSYLYRMVRQNDDDLKTEDLTQYIGSNAKKYCSGFKTRQYTGNLNGQEITRGGKWKLYDFTRMPKRAGYILAVGTNRCYVMTNYRAFMVPAYDHSSRFKSDIVRKLSRPQATFISLASTYKDAADSKKCDRKFSYRYLYERKSSISSSNYGRRSRPRTNRRRSYFNSTRRRTATRRLRRTVSYRQYGSPNTSWSSRFRTGMFGSSSRRTRSRFGDSTFSRSSYSGYNRNRRRY